MTEEQKTEAKKTRVKRTRSQRVAAERESAEKEVARLAARREQAASAYNAACDKHADAVKELALLFGPTDPDMANVVADVVSKAG